MRSLIRPQDWPIATKLIIAFLAVALIPLIVAGIINSSRATEGLLNSAELNLINTARRTSANIDDYVASRRSDVQQIATDESVINFLTADRSTLDLRSNRDALAARRLLVNKRNALGATSYFFIARVDKDLSLNGQVELTSNTEKDQEGAVPPDELRNVSDQTYFLEAQKGFYYISEPILTQFSDVSVEGVMYYSVPVRDSNGTLIGVVVARSTLFPIWQIINNDLGVAGPGSFGMLVDNTNRLGIRIADSRIKDRPDLRTQYIFSIMRPLATAPGQPNSRGQYVDSKRFPDNFNYANAQKEILPNIYDSAQGDYNKDRPFFSTKLVSNNNEDARVGYAELSVKPSWWYYVVVPQSTYAAAANDIGRFTLIVLVVAAILVAILAFVLSRVLTIPIRRTNRVLTMIGMGDFDARVKVDSQDELGRLGESLNAMFDNTLSLIQTREEKEELQERITTLLQEISTVAEGDLTVEAEVTADITGAIADSFNLMIEELRKVILNIQQATREASTLFDQVVENTQRTDEAANRQANRILSVTSAIGDINRSIQQVSENSNLSTQVAQEAREQAHQGGLAVTKSVASMNRIRGNVQETAKKIKRLGESSQQIGEIVKLIDDIADQTNMLALNAAIQAAMAGEQGKGFSVVAEEVRRLAERSASATREIATLVKSIQDDTAEAVVAMEESTREVVEGSKVADEAGRALGAIESVVDRVADLIFSISQVTQQQAASSSSIAQSMDEISALTMEASALRQESASAVAKLSQIVQNLNASVSTFKVLPSPQEPQIIEASALPEQSYQGQPPTTWQEAVSGEPPFANDQIPDFVFAPRGEITSPGSGYQNFSNQPPIPMPEPPKGYQNGYDNQYAPPPAGGYYERPTPPPPAGGYYERPASPPPAPSAYPDFYYPSGNQPVGSNQGRGAADAGNGKDNQVDDFSLESLLAEDADFFDSIFNEKGNQNGKPGDGRK
jgi:methyl-accepting chemotaxis protein